MPTDGDSRPLRHELLLDDRFHQVPKLSLIPLLAVLSACTPTTAPSGPCSTSADCPTGWVCLFQQCTSPATINANLSAVVWPADPALAPQQFQPFELNPTGEPLSSVAIVLHQPQHLLGKFVLPPSCDAAVIDGTAFPVRMDFVGTSIIPGQSWSFSYQSDRSGLVDGVLPVFESFQKTISPAVSCAPPVLGTQRVLQSGPYDVGQNIAFPSASESLRVIGILTNSDGGSGYPANGPSGALVQILPANPSAGQALSIAVPATGPDSTFDLQIPYAQAGPAPLATLTLSVQPWSGGQRNYPSILMPFEGLIADAGEPTLRVVTLDGGPLVLALPYDDSVLPVVLAGMTQSPVDGGAPLPLPGATVQISSLSLRNCAPDAGACVYQQMAASNVNTAAYSFSQAPPGVYAVTVIPQYPSSSQWFPATLVRDCSVPGACGQCPPPPGECSGFLDVQAEQGLEVSGWVVRSNKEPFNDQGQASIYSLPDMSLLASARLAPDGGFTLYAPPGREMLFITPDEVTGYPSTYMTEDVRAADPTLSTCADPTSISASENCGIEIELPPPGLITGTVSVEAPDGGASLPVPEAAVLFYYVISDHDDPDGGEIAIPVTNGVTDALGNFSVLASPFQPSTQ
jgi:hypothetical protein